ncbi:metallophosphoesterase [Aliiroseovarius sp. S1339]|uniref:metallophosphoesterase n=1 Tax=Aliiroseovarius sp. S1339 TaxID=2936990 RepID=UPI0020BFA9B5|nr:metallophosphoesterase [Aliiroseovarius sp. S1339]MCK8464153.1 metallophosphoesterase [Aliiroseovarius sp. S1339]
MTPLTIPFQHGTLAILSDLHLDSYQRLALDPISLLSLEETLWNADALILAGDLTNGPPQNWARVFQHLSDYIPADHIYALPGNHDYYNGSLDGDAWLAEEARKAGAHFIQKQVLLHGDTRLVCCTLWTDFNLTQNQPAAMQTAQRALRDYDLIAVPDDPDKRFWEGASKPPPRRIRPIDTLNIHLDHRAWLESTLASPHPCGPEGNTVVVTHHGPHPAVAGPVDDLTPSFQSDLGALIKRHTPDAWFFGHSHRRLRAQVHGCDIRNVSVGYAGELIDEPLTYLREACLWDILPVKKRTGK